MKKIYGIILMLILVFSFNSVFANTINSIDMDIYVDEYGTAYVTEVWQCSANEKTEWYHTFNNLRQADITNFTVSDESGTNYETLQDWNINASFEDKKYKCGLNKTAVGVELCFGISEYRKTKTYIAKYEINKFVVNLNDAQMIYWTLLDFDQNIGHAHIKIYSDFDYEDTFDVWGFGNYGGTAYIYDGYIEMDSPGKLLDSQYMTILAKFPKGTFSNVNYDINENFEKYLNMAQANSTAYKNSNDSDIFSAVLITILIFFAIPIIFIIGFITAGGSSNKKLVKSNNEIKNYKDYYRDIPCGKDLYKAYYIAYEFSIIKKKTDILGAIILTWLRNNIVSIEKREVGFFKKENETCIIFTENASFENELEEKLYKMMYAASKDGILEKKELEKYCTNKYNKLFNWFDKLIEQERDKLSEEGLIRKIESKNKIFGKSKYEIADLNAFEQEGKNIMGLKNYLKDYTLIHEREAIEVTLFEDYLIYAQMLGIATTVIKEFKDLYPDLIKDSNFVTYSNINFIHSCSSSGMRHAQSARSEAQSRASSYSGGGGGFSSGGGGGGSFGGGRRRL